jgi:hypothetical protein
LPTPVAFATSRNDSFAPQRRRNTSSILRPQR